jgi:hypothetical protein
MFGAARVPIRMVFCPRALWRDARLQAAGAVLCSDWSRRPARPGRGSGSRLRSGGGRPLLVGDGIVLLLEGIATVDNLALPRLQRRGILMVIFPPSPYRSSCSLLRLLKDTRLSSLLGTNHLLTHFITVTIYPVKLTVTKNVARRAEGQQSG